MLLPQAQLWGQGWNWAWVGFETSSTQCSPSIHGCCPFLPCFPPALCMQPATSDQLLCPSSAIWLLQHLIFCNHTVNFPLWGAGTPCCRRVPLKGWADVLEHISFVLRRAQRSMNLLPPCKKRIWDLDCLKLLWETVSTLTKYSEGSERWCALYSKAAKPGDSRHHILVLHSWLLMRYHVHCQGWDLVLSNVSQAC